VDAAAFAERQNVFVPFSRHAGLHQSRRSLGNNYFLVRRNVIAMGMRNEGEPLRIPGIKPQIQFGQINTARVSNVDHDKIYACLV